jgi:DNA polymerase III epsilon subunit family exonuclease
MSSHLQISEFLRHQTFVAFDTETTGLLAPFHRLVEIAGVKFRLGDEVCEAFQSLINPARPIPPDVIPIHGITDEIVADAPGAGVVLKQFVAFCGEDSLLIAHHALFDISVVCCEMDRAGMSYPQNRGVDTVDIYHHLYPDLESYSLLALAQEFSLAESQEHRALADAHLVRALFLDATEQMGCINSCDDLRSRFAVYTLSDWPGRVEELPSEFGELNRALKESLRVEIFYRSPTKPPEARIIQPRQVYLHNLTFYIGAYCEQAQAERTFRLDRIEAFRVLDGSN